MRRKSQMITATVEGLCDKCKNYSFSLRLAIDEWLCEDCLNNLGGKDYLEACKEIEIFLNEITSQCNGSATDSESVSGSSTLSEVDYAAMM